MRVRRRAVVPHDRGVIVVQPVLELPALGYFFSLWPIADEPEPYDFLPLHGRLGPAEVGTAVMALAASNGGVLDAPVDAFLHGLLTNDSLFAPGGLRVTDTTSGITLVPGCCSGLEDRGDWSEVLGDEASAGSTASTGTAWFGHQPSPLAERQGDTVRLTVDTDDDDSPHIDIPVPELTRLLAEAEQDLTDFLHLTTDWTTTHLLEQTADLPEALRRALARRP